MHRRAPKSPYFYCGTPRTTSSRDATGSLARLDGTILIAEMHVGFEQPFDGQVLAERVRLQINTGKLLSPEGIVLVWIRIDGLGASAVNR